MKINKSLFCLITFFFFSMSIFAQDIHLKIRQSLTNREYKSAITELQNLRKTDKKVFQANNYDYLLARISEKDDNLSTAIASYQSVVKRKSNLKEYALWHLSRIMRSSGNLLMEKVYLQQLNALYPNSLLTEAANKRLAISNFESGNFQTTIALLTSQNTIISAAKTQNDAKYRENLVFIGQSQLALGDLQNAKNTFTLLIDKLPNQSQPDDFALAAAKGLDIIDGKQNGGNLSQLSVDEHQKRGGIYQFNRDFENARIHFNVIVAKKPSNEDIADALYQIGRGYVQNNELEESIKYFERVINEFPEDVIAKDATSQSASAFAKQNKPNEAISRYQKIIQKYPNSDNIERSYLNLVDSYRDLGDDKNALIWAAKTQEMFRGKLPETIGLFNQLRIRISQNDWATALSDADKLLLMNDLGGVRVPSGTNKNEITFLRGFILESMQRYSEAIDVYLSIADGRNEYYGSRASEKLRSFSQNEFAKALITSKIATLSANINSSDIEANRKNAQAILRLTENAELRQKMIEIVRQSYAKLPAYQKIPSFKLLEFGRKEVLKDTVKNSLISHEILANELLFLGLYDEGTPELEASFREKLSKTTGSLADFPPDIAFTLATFYNRGDMANRSVAFIEPFWRNVPSDYLIELIPREQAMLLYPIPYVDSLLKFSPQKGIDPRFALSIMRQESRYRADVKSVAAARGLMQFISTTSNDLAKELGKPNFKQDELYNPPTAILFGSQYLSNLFKLFPNQPQAVAASYNGGEINMARWLTRSKTDLADRYVSEIIFSQSKDYVYKVMANYRVYQVVYDENLRVR
jgi:soluble lytic murein transglycosylase